MTFDPAYAEKVLDEACMAPEPHTIILGAGSSTRLILHQIKGQGRRRIRAILDDDPGLAGGNIHGFPIRLPRDYCSTQVDRVIITSQMHEAALTRRAHELFGPEAWLVYTFDRDKSLPCQLTDVCRRIQLEWDDGHPDDALWFTADQLHSALGRQLAQSTTWRYGPERQINEFAELRRHLDTLVNWRRSALLNFGCGPYHPLGISLLALVCGAGRTTASDLQPILDPQRTCQAMQDLISRIVLDPKRAFGPQAPARIDLLTRIESVVNLDRLNAGDLPGAVDGEALAYRVESIYETRLSAAAFDVIVSRDVLEHLPDAPQALAILYKLLRPGGVMFLVIDFADHRRYQNPKLYDHWSHLIDTNEPTHLNTNRLRFPQYRPMFDEAGFETIRYEPRSIEPLPCNAKASLAPMYQVMSDQDLAASSAVAVLRKPR